MQKLLSLMDRLDAVNDRLGKLLSYGLLALIFVQFAIVVMAANFQAGSIKLQESVLYINSLVFLGAAGYTLLTDGHVRVDIFYRDAAPRTKARIDFFGTLFFLTPFLVFLWWVALPYVITSLRAGEGSFETSGLQLVWLLKSFILLFAASLSLQAVSLAVRSYFAMRKG